MAGRRCLYQSQDQEQGENFLELFLSFFLPFFTLKFLQQCPMSSTDTSDTPLEKICIYCDIFVVCVTYFTMLYIQIFPSKSSCWSCLFGWKYLSFYMRKPSTRISNRIGNVLKKSRNLKQKILTQFSLHKPDVILFSNISGWPEL